MQLIKETVFYVTMFKSFASLTLDNLTATLIPLPFVTLFYLHHEIKIKSEYSWQVICSVAR